MATFGDALQSLLGHEVEKRREASGAPILAGSKKRAREESAAAEALREKRERQRRRREKRLLLGKDHKRAQYDAKEKRLVKIATRGVVTLFNAVAKQQKEAAREEAAREEAARGSAGGARLTGGSQDAFLTMLKRKDEDGAAGSGDDGAEDGEEGGEGKAGKGEAGGKWGILDDNYMMGAKMKDWDKDEDDSESGADDK